MHAVQKMVHPKPHHKQHGEERQHHRPSPPEEEHRPEHHRPEHKFITRDEFDLYDSLKTMCAISIFMFAKLIALGKCGKRIAWKNKFEVTRRLHKKSCFCLLLLIVTTIFAWREGKNIGRIMRKIHHHKPEHHGPYPEREFPQEEGAIFSVDGRHLKEVDTATTAAPMTFQQNAAVLSNLKDDEAVCHANKDEGSCHTNAKCSWCKSAAVASACHSLSNAASLPAAVFECSPLPSTEKKQIEEASVDQSVKKQLDDLL
jgi:hypothetical protein